MAVSDPESRPPSVRMSRAAVVEVEEEQEEKLEEEEEEKQPLGGSITSPPTALLLFSCVKDTWISSVSHVIVTCDHLLELLRGAPAAVCVLRLWLLIACGEDHDS